MKKLNITTLRSYGPCYDPTKYLPEEWEGTALDILDNESIPIQDRFWVVLRTDLVSEKLLRLFAIWCARQVVKPDADPRTLFVLEFMEAYVENYWLVGCADYRALWDQERYAACSAACSAAWSAAYSAACSAAWSAAYSAACSAAWSAAYSAAWSAAGSAAYSLQQAKLRELIIAGVETGDVKT